MENFQKQGDKLFKEGKKELKTGLLKWKPDYDAAAPKFEEAAKFYKNGQKWDKMIEALDQYCYCCRKTEDHWGVARQLEAILQVQCEHPELIKNEKDFDNMADECAQYFKVSDSVANILKLFKIIAKYYQEQKNNMQKAVSYSTKAYQHAMEGKSYNVSEILDFHVDMLVQNKQYIDAIKVYREQLKFQKENKTAAVVEFFALLSAALCLIMDDPIQAERELEHFATENLKVATTQEYQAARSLIELYQNGEQEEFQKKVARPPVNMQHPPIIPRLLKKVKCQQQQQQLQQNNLQPQNQQSQFQQGNTEQKEEENQQEKINNLLF